MAASIVRFWPRFLALVAPLATLAEYNSEEQERVKLKQKLLRQSFSSRRNLQVSVSHYPNAWRNQVGFSESDAGRESAEDI